MRSKAPAMAVATLAALIVAGTPAAAQKQGGTLKYYHRDNPPTAPRVRQGKDVFRGMFEHCAAAGVKATVENAIVGADRAAATVTCEFPGGRKVVANGIFELQDGRIVRERDVLAGDPK